MEADSKTASRANAVDAGCPVCGWPMGRKPVARIIGEVEWRFCCFGCASTQYLIHLLKARGVKAGEPEGEVR